MFINHVSFYLVITDVCIVRLSGRSASDYLVGTKGILVHPSSEVIAICRHLFLLDVLFSFLIKFSFLHKPKVKRRNEDLNLKQVHFPLMYLLLIPFIS